MILNVTNKGKKTSRRSKEKQRSEKRTTGLSIAAWLGIPRHRLPTAVLLQRADGEPGEFVDGGRVIGMVVKNR